MTRKPLSKTPDKETIERVKLAIKQIENYESYYEDRGIIPWDTFETPIGYLYWARVRETGRLRLFLEDHEIPVVGMKIDTKLAVAKALPKLGDA